MSDKKHWLIISWKHDSYMDGGYGKILGTIFGTYEDAVAEAKAWTPMFSPVGVVGEITA